MKYPRLSSNKRNASPTSGLAFLVLLTLVCLQMLTSPKGAALISTSPVVPQDATSPLQPFQSTVVSQPPEPSPTASTEPSPKGTPGTTLWPSILGIGTIVLGLVLVIGGLIVLLRQRYDEQK